MRCFRPTAGSLAGPTGGPVARPGAGLPRVLLLLVLVAATGCGHNVGDACKTNVDCSPLGDRFCDLASVGGYCTVEGCDVRLNNSGDLQDSCPSEAVCVRFFTLVQSEPCDPATDLQDCKADERCLCDCADPAKPGACTPVGGTCPNGSVVTRSDPNEKRAGHCAPETSERRWCLLKCSTNSDCRDGYECRAAGTNGAELIPGEPPDGNHPPKFCVQKQ